MNRFMEGESLYLRGFEPSDLETWYQWFNNPEVTDLMNKGYYPNTIDTQTAFFQKLKESRFDIQLAIVTKEDNTLTGTIGLHRIDWIHRHGDVSVLVGNPRAFGRGIGTQAIGLICALAFRHLNLHKLTAGMWAPNHACRKSFEKNGFIHEGTLKEQFFYKGGWVDEFRYGLIRDSWKHQKE